MTSWKSNYTHPPVTPDEKEEVSHLILARLVADVRALRERYPRIASDDSSCWKDLASSLDSADSFLRNQHLD